MTAPLTVLDSFRGHVRDRGDRPALRVRRDTGWDVIDWAQYGRMVDMVAAGLSGLGVKPGDRVAILASNRPEWHSTDLAVMSIGAVTVPLYPTAAPAQIAYLLEHCGASVCIVEDASLLTRVAATASNALAALEWIICLDVPVQSGPTDIGATSAPRTLSFDELQADGAASLSTTAALVRDLSAAVRPDHLATIVYTSGTTGPPRGALLTHRNLVATVTMITDVLPIGPADRFLSFLPLSHIAERVVSHLGQIVSGGETWFARSLSTVPEDLLDCRPTVFFAVPRVWEKMRDALGRRLAAAPRPLVVLVGLQRHFVRRVEQKTSTGRFIGVVNRLCNALFDRTVGHAIRKRIGLDHTRLLLSGAAPIDDGLVRWLHEVGIAVGQVYGQTEVCGPTSMSRPGRIRIGTVGMPLPGEEVLIAEDGEVLVRGPNVCAGYLDDAIHTGELIDPLGWLHTGDVGRFDADGELRIIGRKKDLIATAQGKKIAPQEIENRLRADRFISQVVVVGEGRPYLVALITVDLDAITDWATSRGKSLAIESLADDPDVHRHIADAVETLNGDLSSFEQIKRWTVLPRDLTIDAGELTPTLKIIRPVVTQHYADRIDELYEVEADRLAQRR